MEEKKNISVGGHQQLMNIESSIDRIPSEALKKALLGLDLLLEDFDQLKAQEINFQVYNRTYPLEIWFDSDRQHVRQHFPLGRHKICVDDQRAHLLRPFRNLGADGFAALSNRLLAQEGIAIDPKNTVESLLIELGTEELLRHYQEALNRYNQQASMRRSAGVPDDEELPLIITKTRQRTRSGGRDDRATVTQPRIEPIPDEVYERLAFAFERHFSEVEEDLMHVSLEALRLDRGAVIHCHVTDIL